MYKEHPDFKKPKDENARIWRYMDFTQFISILDKSALFFTRVDNLEDPFEGSCPIEVVKLLLKNANLQTDTEYVKGFFKKLNKCTAVNCWHLNQYESDAMWKIYLKSNEGIAVQSSFERLRDSLRDEIHDIFIGKVEYVDYDKIGKVTNPYLWLTNSILRKRKIFKHEQELRAVIRKLPKRELSPSSKSTIGEGIYVPVDLNILIDKIFLAPTSLQWQFDLLKSTISKYRLNKEVLQSSLDDKSYFL